MTRVGWSDHWLAATALVAAVFLGHAIQRGNGTTNGVGGSAVIWLVLALGVALAGVLPGSDVVRERRARSALPPLVLAGLGWELFDLVTQLPGNAVHFGSRTNEALFYLGVAVAAGIAASALRPPRGLEAWQFPALLLVYFGLGCWVIKVSPDPGIDVVYHHRDAIAALGRGADPYALTFPNIYVDEAFFGPGVIQNGRFMYGFGYPPLSLLWAVPGQWSGDYRYSMLVAILASAALMAYARPSRASFAIAGLFLLTPRSFFVIEQGWTEPVLLLTVTAVGFAAVRLRDRLPLAVGLLVSAKQYAILGLPAILLTVWRPRGDRAWAKEALVAIGAAAATIVPFFLWDPHAMYRSLVEVHTKMPFRVDALSLPSFWVRAGNEIPPGWLRVLAGFGLAAVAVWRAPRNAAGCVAGIALTYLCFFVFRQGFANYYFLVIGCLSMTATLATEPEAAAARQ